MNEVSHAPTPRNPTPGIVYGVIWLLIAAILGILLLSYSGNTEALSDVSGQRTVGFVVFMPFIALVASIFCFLRAASAAAPYKQYVATTTPQQRQKDEAARWKNADKIGGLIAFAVIAALGWLALLVVLIVNYANITSSTQSLTSFVGAFLLVGLAAGSLVRLAVRISNSRHHA